MEKRLLSFSIALLIVLTLLLPINAGASNFYIIHDSYSRYLTEEELWEWQYSALGFILNEIFARHGFPFDPDGNYYDYFNAQSWYREDPDFSYSSINSIEWHNEHLVKVVRQQMRDLGTKNPEGKPLPETEPTLYNIPDEFEEYVFVPGQKLKVYTGPGTQYVRAAGGKAMASTNGTVYAYGFENGWLMVLYRVSKGGARIGFVDSAQIIGDFYLEPLEFACKNATVTRSCSITDDPVSEYAPLAKLREGDTVLYLCTLHNNSEWAYVEAETSAGLLRGCIPADALMTED